MYIVDNQHSAVATKSIKFMDLVFYFNRFSIRVQGLYEKETKHFRSVSFYCLILKRYYSFENNSISTRLFLALPAAVLLVAIGLSAPKPDVCKAVAGTPLFTK